MAGSAFAKSTEHWSDGPAGHYGGSVAAVAYTATVVSAAVGALAVAAGMALALPAWWHSIGSGTWTPARRPLAWAGGAVAGAAAATVGLAHWAHHLSSAQRNGGMAWYGVAYGAWGLLMVAVIALATRAAFAVERRLDLPGRVVRAQAVAALSATGAVAVTAAAMLTWWVARLTSGGAGSAPGTWPSWSLAVAAALAVGATALAGVGSGRILGAWAGSGPGPRR